MAAAVLIVPYGIEMNLTVSISKESPVLIVPYGIEIKVGKEKHGSGTGFNRTLWN